MAVLNILTSENKKLRQKAKPIAADSLDKIQELATNLRETMEKKDGIGLAAPQIGQSVRLICIHQNAFSGSEHLLLVNPKITFFSKKRIVDEEGCLSVPDFFGLVSRADKIRVNYLDLQGHKLNLKAKGMFARVLQHEIDHLDGILFIDKLEK